MSQELLYTSASEGLNPGDQGFCTVVCTQGMPRNLKEFLENLSGYRQADRPPHPVNYSHLSHNVGGKRYQILSRVGDFDKDYSGRTNKLAHHVALSLDELPAAGPAALLKADLCRDQWDGKTGWIPNGPALPSALAYSGPCPQWAKLAGGDPGWAGVLAESALDASGRPTYVIFAPGDDVLPLVVEALGLLPREKYWTTSFSTYFTKLPAGVDCQWRFVLDHSPEADQVRSASHSLKIDLVELRQSHRRAPDGKPHVEAARAGKALESVPGGTVGSGTLAPSAASAMSAGSTAAGSTITEPAARPSPFAGSAVAVPSPFGTPFGQERKPASKKLPWILGGGAAVLVIALGAMVFMILKNAQVPTPVIASESGESSERQRRSSPNKQENFASAREEARKKADEEARQKAEADKLAKADAEEAARKAEADRLAKADAKRPKVSRPVKPIDRGDWNKDILAKKNYLPLPKPDQIISTAAIEATNLAPINVPNPSDLDLSIISTAGQSEEAGFVLTVNDEDADDVKLRRWIVERKTVDPFTKLERRAEVGTFELKAPSAPGPSLGHSSEDPPRPPGEPQSLMLSFQWKMPPTDWAKPQGLQYCLLNATFNGQTETCYLSEPTIKADLVFDFTKRNVKIEFPVSEHAVDDPLKLRLDLNVSGLEKSIPLATGLQIVTAGKGAKKDKANQFSFLLNHKLNFKSNPKLKLNGDVEIELTFELDNQKRPILVANAYVFPTFVRPPKEFYSQRTPEGIILSQFDAIKKQAVRSGNSEKSLLEKITIKDIPTLLKQLKQEKEFRKDALKGDKGPVIQAAAEEIVKRIDEAISQLKGEADARGANVSLATANAKWCDEMETNLAAIQKTARIGYSLYVEVDGKKVYLVRTKSQVEPEKLTAAAKPEKAKP